MLGTLLNSAKPSAVTLVVATKQKRRQPAAAANSSSSSFFGPHGLGKTATVHASLWLVQILPRRCFTKLTYYGSVPQAAVRPRNCICHQVGTHPHADATQARNSTEELPLCAKKYAVVVWAARNGRPGRGVWSFAAIHPKCLKLSFPGGLCCALAVVRCA